MRTFGNALLWFLLGLVVLMILLFALQNTVQVPLDLIFHRFAPRTLALWLVLAFLCGVLVGLLSCAIAIAKLRLALRRERRKT